MQFDKVSFIEVGQHRSITWNWVDHSLRESEKHRECQLKNIEKYSWIFFQVTLDGDLLMHLPRPWEISTATLNPNVHSTWSITVWYIAESPSNPLLSWRIHDHEETSLGCCDFAISLVWITTHPRMILLDTVSIAAIHNLLEKWFIGERWNRFWDQCHLWIRMCNVYRLCWWFRIIIECV